MKKQEDTSLTQQAKHSLRHDIMLNEVAPGTKITIDSIKKSYNMGGSPIREALNQLVVARWVDALPLRGFCVQGVSCQQHQDLLQAQYLLESQLMMTSLKQHNDHWESLIVASYYRLGKVLPPSSEAWEEKGQWVSRKEAFLLTLMMESVSPWLYAVYKNTVRHILRYEVFMTLNTLSDEPVSLMATDYQGVVDAVTQSSTAEVKQQLVRLNEVATDRAKLFWSHYNESTG